MSSYLMIHGFYACPVNATDTKAPDLAIFKTFPKIFKLFKKKLGHIY